jgi:hypothetical protein
MSRFPRPTRQRRPGSRGRRGVHDLSFSSYTLLRRGLEQRRHSSEATTTLRRIDVAARDNK